MSERLIQKYKAQVYEWGGCYEKMLEALTSVIYLSEFENYEINNEERDLVSICIKHKVSESRNKILQIIKEQRKQIEYKNFDYAELCDEYILTLKKDIQIFLKLIEEVVNHLVAITEKAKLFKTKIKSDISRYNLELNLSELTESKKIYEDAYELVKNYPDFRDPLVLSFTLNFGTLLAEKCDEKKRAIDILSDICEKYQELPEEEELDYDLKTSNSLIQEIKRYIQKLS